MGDDTDTPGEEITLRVRGADGTAVYSGAVTDFTARADFDWEAADHQPYSAVGTVTAAPEPAERPGRAYTFPEPRTRLKATVRAMVGPDEQVRTTMGDLTDPIEVRGHQVHALQLGVNAGVWACLECDTAAAYPTAFEAWRCPDAPAGDEEASDE